MLKTLLSGTGNYRHYKLNANETVYTYFGNIIAVVNDKDYIFTLNSCGYHTRSTTRALNDLQRYYEGKGYTLLRRN